jgi:hypothetical protein
VDFIVGVVVKIYIKGDTFKLASGHTRKVCDLFNVGPIMWIGIVVMAVCVGGVGGGEVR